MQDEELTVVSGEMTYLVMGEEPKIARKGDTALFKRVFRTSSGIPAAQNLYAVDG